MSTLIHTRGIVFHKLKFSDTSLIVKIYTEDLGLRSYLLKGIRAKLKGKQVAFYSAMSLLDLVVYERGSKDLQHLKEVRSGHLYHRIPFNEARHAILLFINEVLYRAIREEESNPPLFSFIWDQMVLLDELTEVNPNFHLLFLLELSKHLGFSPDANYQPGTNSFSIREGSFCSSTASDESLLNPELSRCLFQLMQNGDAATFNNDTRRALLNALLDFFHYHLEGMSELKSQRVFEQVFKK